MTVAKRPTISPEARAQIHAATALYGPEYECLFEAAWDEGRQSITAVRLVMRGNRGQVQMLAGCFATGSIHLHTHPEGRCVEPSDDDLEVAARLAMMGCGSAVCSPTGDAIYMICTPMMIAPFTPAPPARKTIFTAGRFSLFHWSDQKFWQLVFTH